MGRSESRVWRWAMMAPCAVALAGWGGVDLRAGERADGERQPQAQTRFTTGPPLAPAAAALAYLDGLAFGPRPARVRLPVSLTLDEFRLAIVDARLGPPGDAAAPRLLLDDGALGVGLVDRARDLCADGQPCVLRIVGYWRGTSAGVGRLDVRRVDGPSPETAVAFIEIEARSPP